jgi:phytoene dehydrogenase-like protein
MLDAVVVGSGPNGLAAAIALARRGVSVRVLEGRDEIGGGTRSAELTLPGFVHDVCAAIHPLGLASPFFKQLPLSEHGLEWIQPPAPLAHPFDDGTAAVLDRSIDATAATLGVDSGRYRRLMEPMGRDPDPLFEAILGPPALPRHPLALGHFAARAALPATTLARLAFRGERARGLFAGLAGHSMLPLTRTPSAAFGLVLGLLGHTVGWPLARGGSQQIAEALASYLRSLGGEVETGRPVTSLAELDDARAVLLDVTPRQFVALAAERLPRLYRHRLEGYRYGPGVFKVDWALDAPIPWRAEDCARAATVHLGGVLAEIAASERAVWRNQTVERPYVLLAQPSLFDPTRAPPGRHTAWAYCHVPNRSRADMTTQIEAQVERFAPGFGERILGRSTMDPAAMEAYNPNYVGGDINGGAADLRQLFTRPVARLSPYTTPLEGVFLCSSSTPPGGGVHGMCGYNAAQVALRHLDLRV